MNSAHTAHNQLKQRKPKYFYDTPFSYIALLLALMMVIPIPRVMPVPEARADSGFCECNDGSSHFTLAFPLQCSSLCADHGGWSGEGGGPIDIGGCAQLEVFNGSTSCSADVLAFDPDSGDPIVEEKLFAGPQLDTLEQQAINDVLTLHGLPAVDKDRLLTWGRDRVRAQLFARLVNIIQKPAAQRTESEQVLYTWLTNIVWQKRIDAAQFAWDQYLGWQNAVDYATCRWQPPNSVYWQPKWLTDLDDPQLISCQDDITVGGQTVQRLCQLNGCSPGLDGAPRTDPTPNQGEIEDILAGRDDGEVCFASGEFSYDTCTATRCAGQPLPAFCTVALPTHPTYEQFKGYGAALAQKNFVHDPSFVSIVGSTSKTAAFGIALGSAALIAGAVTGVAGVTGGTAAFTSALFPFAASGATFVGALFATVFTVVLAVIVAIIGAITLAEFEQLDDNLIADVRTAASSTNTAQGKPDLATLITTDAGKQEIFLAFIETVGPEIDLSGRTAPAPGNEPLWAVMEQNRTPLPTESGQLLTFTSWDDIIGKTGLFGGWFVPQIPQIGGTVQNALALGIEYVKPNGEQWTAWRTTCQDQTNAACTFGQAIFVHTRNGDEPPMGLSEEEFATWFANASTEITYKNDAGAARIARLNRRPTATGFMVSGTAEEGQQFTLNGTGSDPDGDSVSLVWNFNDGTDTATGSSVQHTFADSGSFNVTMTPTDAFGATGSPRTESVTIANVAPTATFAPPAAVNEGSPIKLSLTDPSDPSSADTSAGFQYAFDCGSGFGAFSSMNKGECPTTDNGERSVRAQIKDKDGGVSEYSATATINNVPPQGLLLSQDEVPEGEPFIFSFFSVSNFDPSPVDETSLQFAFSCGDGFGAFSSMNKGECPAPDNGVFPFAGRIKDKDGGVGESSGTQTVTNVAPTATFTATPQIFQGEGAMLTFSEQTDPSSVDTAAGFTYAYDCTANGTLSVANSGAATATCTYLTTGTFTVGGTISDKDQGATSYTASVTVLSPQLATDTLKAQVQALNSQGALNGGQTNALTVKLDTVVTFLDGGKKTDAVSMLQSFISQVNDLVNKDHVLTAAQGQELIDTANRVIASIAVS